MGAGCREPSTEGGTTRDPFCNIAAAWVAVGEAVLSTVWSSAGSQRQHAGHRCLKQSFALQWDAQKHPCLFLVQEHHL